MSGIWLRFLSGPDIDSLGITRLEVIGAVESVVAAHGRGETVFEPRVHLVPDNGDGSIRGHFNVLRGHVSTLGEHGVSGVKVEHFLLSDELVGPLRAAGITVSTGTVNDVDLLEEVLRVVPRCITTDRPHELRSEALARGLLPVGYELQVAA